MSVPAFGLYTNILPLFSNVYSSEIALPVKSNFYVEPSLEGGTKLCINGLGHMAI